MHSLTFEDVFLIARSLARKKANGAIGHCGLSPADRDDIESELLLTFYVAFPKFDSERASVRTFASRVMDKELKSILRHRLAKCRRQLLEAKSLDDLADLGQKSTRIDRQRFWMDMDRALAPCSAALRETAVALCWESPLQLSRSLGRSRACIYDRIRRLRNAFDAAGIEPDYFGS